MKLTATERFTYFFVALPPIIFGATILYTVHTQQEAQQQKINMVLNTVKQSVFKGVNGKDLLVRDIIRHDNNCWKLTTYYQTQNIYLTYCLDKKNTPVLKNMVHENIV